MKEAAIYLLLTAWLLVLAGFSWRYSRRVRRGPGSPDPTTVRTGILWVFAFPAAIVTAIFGLVAVIDSSSEGDQASPAREQRFSGCYVVRTAIHLLSSESESTRNLGSDLAEGVWSRTLTDAAYTNELREECAPEVIQMVDLAGLSWQPEPFD